MVWLHVYWNANQRSPKCKTDALAIIDHEKCQRVCFFGFVLYLLILINCTVCGAITPSHHTTAFPTLTVGYSPQTESYLQSNLP